MSSDRAISHLRTHGRRNDGGMRRGWIARMLPVALLALIIQVLAPVAASAITAAAIVAEDLLGGAVICHSEPDATPAKGDTDRTACGLDCVMCCVLHAAAAVDTPPAAIHVVPLRRWARIAWNGRELGLVHLLARAQTQPRGPPFLS